MRKLSSRFLTFIAVLVIAFGAVACTEATADPDQDKSRQVAVADREENFKKAEAMWPVPKFVNYPLRRALVEFTKRQDMINHPWYIYVLGMDGTPVGYFVGQTYPQSACNFLSDSKRFVPLDTVSSGPDVYGETTAPSYDGVFYGGGGSSAACESMFFFDASTNAMHTFNAPFWFASDQPINLDVPRLGTEGHTEEPIPVATPTPTEGS